MVSAEVGSVAHAVAAAPTPYSQHKPLTGRQKPAPEASSMCPLADF